MIFTSDGSRLCECGCGRETPLATRTRNGNRKGEQIRFVPGHTLRALSPEMRAKLSANRKGKTNTAEHNRRISEGRKASPNVRGEMANGWKGGVVVREGRRHVLVGIDHPMSRPDGYVLEHRLVMFAVLGRPLLRTEHVHHRDLNPMNNAPENLIVLTPSQHTRLHLLIRRKGMSTLDALAQVLGHAAAPAGS